MRITDRYASAVRSTNLKSEAKTVMADPDVLGAMGIADRRLSAGEGTFTPHPLAVPLERLFAGDRSSAGDIIRILTEEIRGKAPSMRLRITDGQAAELGRVVLAWFRDSRCKACGGHGWKIIPGTTTLGTSKCTACNNTGLVQIEEAFHKKEQELVRWVIAQLEREAGQAGPAAMKALAPTLDLS